MSPALISSLTYNALLLNASEEEYYNDRLFCLNSNVVVKSFMKLNMSVIVFIHNLLINRNVQKVGETVDACAKVSRGDNFQGS